MTAWPPQRHQDVQEAVAVLRDLTTTGRLTDAALKADPTFTGTVGLPGGGSGNPRQPVNGAVVIDGPTGKNFPGDKVGYAFSAIIQGDFTGDTGGNPLFAWGANDYVITGTNAGDLTALANLTARETEVHLQSPNANLDYLTALQVDATVDDTATGAHVGTMYGVHVTALVDQAAGAVVDNAFGMYIEEPTAAANNVALGVSGKVLFYGDVQLVDSHLVAGNGGVSGRTMQLGQPGDVPTGGMFTAKAAADSDVITWLQTRGGQTGDVLRITMNAADVQWARFDKIGRLGISNPYAPGAGDLRTGEVMFTFDDTAGAAKLVLTAKDAGGTMRSATVALS